MLGYANVSNYSPSWNEWGEVGAGTQTDYPCSGEGTGCKPTGDNICNGLGQPWWYQ